MCDCTYLVSYRAMLVDVLVPVFLLVGVGWILGRFLRLDGTPLARVTFWCLSPALIFESLRTAELPPESVGLVAAFVVAHYLTLFLISIPLRRRLFPDDRDAQVAASLVLVFGNCGNLGLPILLFAYGQAGVEVGAVFLAVNSILFATLGIWIACWEGSSSWRKTAINFFKVPWPYVLGAVALARWLGGLPVWLTRATGLLSQGAVPVLVLLLGVQLAHVRPQELAGSAVALAVARLLLSAMLAWGLTAAFRVQGILRGSLIVEGSVPTAVNSFLLSLQYERQPDLAAAVLLLSTLLSAGTLSLTLFLLSAWV